MPPGKIERLLTLMNVLMDSPRAVPAAELRLRVPGYPEKDTSFHRAFERDKTELREMGVPLLLESVPGADPPVEGYRIRSADYELRNLHLEQDELDALHLAAAVVGLDGGAGRRALFKLGSGPAAEMPRTQLPGDRALSVAFAGVAERRQLRFHYRDVERLVDPFRLEFARGRWYLYGWDHARDDGRWFRLGRISGEVELVGPAGSFERPGDEVRRPSFEPWTIGGSAEEAVLAEVWFHPEVSALIRLELADAEIVSDDEQGLVARIEVTNREGFRSWLLSFLDRAEVLGPVDLRHEVVEWLTAVAEGRDPEGSGTEESAPPRSDVTGG